jgi:hypothetical protein
MMANIVARDAAQIIAISQVCNSEVSGMLLKIEERGGNWKRHATYLGYVSSR